MRKSQELEACPLPRGVRPVPCRAYGIQACVADSRLVARASQAPHLALADDVGYQSMTQLQQVRRCEAAAAVVVVRDDVNGGQERFTGARDDGRDRAAQTVHLVDGGRSWGAYQDEAVDPQVGQGLDGIGFGPPVRQERAEPMLVQYRTQAVEELDVPGVGQVVDDHADGPGAPLGQAARHRVRAVPEFVDSLEHGPPLLLTDPG